MNKQILILATMLILTAGCSTLPTAQRVASADATHSYVLSGNGTPTVILEAGLGDGKESWSPVFEEISLMTSVFAYDRAGYGMSRSPNQRRDGATIVRELRSTLSALQLKPPYVLVGHSVGGTYMELYARKYPDEIAGVVLVDSRHADFSGQCLAANAGPCEPPAFAMAMMPHAPRNEMAGSEQTMQQVMNAGAFPDVPLAVLTSGKQLLVSARFQKTWLHTQELLAAMSGRSTHTVCRKCGHYIHRDNPKLVVDAVRNVVRMARME